MSDSPLKTPKLHTQQELKELFFNPVAHEVQSAHIHYGLYRELRKRIRGYLREYNNSPAFWQLTMNAHFLATISCLLRAYDYSHKGMNLARLLEMLRDGPYKPWVPPAETSSTRSLPTRAQFDRDIKSIGFKDSLAFKLLWQRDNLYAHKNHKNILEDRAEELKNTLTHAQFMRLLDRANRLINRYGSIYIGNQWSMTVVGNGDHMYVLRALKEASKKYEVQMKAEEREIRREIMERKKKPKP